MHLLARFIQNVLLHANKTAKNAFNS